MYCKSLRGNEHASCSYELYFPFTHYHDREKSVKAIDGQEDGLRVEVVLLADLEHPLDEN